MEDCKTMKRVSEWHSRHLLKYWLKTSNCSSLDRTKKAKSLFKWLMLEQKFLNWSSTMTYIQSSCCLLFTNSSMEKSPWRLRMLWARGVKTDFKNELHWSDNSLGKVRVFSLLHPLQLPPDSCTGSYLLSEHEDVLNLQGIEQCGY